MKEPNADLLSYRMKLKALSPVFVGGGSEAVLDRTGYIYDAVQKKVYIVDEAKLSAFLSSRPGLYEEYLEYVRNNAGEAGSQR